MTPAILIFIALMWVPIGILLFGHGAIQATGFVTGVVGFFVIVGAFIQATVFADVWTAGLLFIHGIFYTVVAYSFMTQCDLKAAGNVSLTTALGSTVYALVWLIGGPEVDGEPLVAQSTYLFIMAAIYAILTYMVFLNAYNKLSGKLLAVSLWIGAIVSLWIPAFWLLVDGDLPF
jgi:hypothetical protein